MAKKKKTTRTPKKKTAKGKKATTRKATQKTKKKKKAAKKSKSKKAAKKTAKVKKKPAKKKTKTTIPKTGPLKLMVASTVYGFETEITQLCGILSAYGYDILNSHIGTIRVPHRTNPTQACVKAVGQCHVFLGIGRPFYGSGITHKEFSEAIRLDKPRWFVTHSYVTFSRQLFRQYKYDKKKKKPIPLSITFEKTPVMDDLRVIDMYEEAICASAGIDDRRWAQEFFHFAELLTFVETNFKDLEWMREQCLEESKP